MAPDSGGRGGIIKKCMTRIVDYSTHEKEIRTVRNTVFTDEQGISEKLDFDGVDPECYHVLVQAPDGQPIGTGRMQKDGHIGRLAVTAPWRGKGIGKALLQELISCARSLRLKGVYCNAQEQAIGFYNQYGFVCEGEKFYEAGIVHIKMVYSLHDK